MPALQASVMQGEPAVLFVTSIGCTAAAYLGLVQLFGAIPRMCSGANVTTVRCRPAGEPRAPPKACRETIRAACARMARPARAGTVPARGRSGAIPSRGSRATGSPMRMTGCGST